jgi:hypothetical protein
MQPAIRVIGNGAIGGKASGYWKARQVIFSETTLAKHPEFERMIYFPRTICIATDIFDEFITINGLNDLLEKCQSGKQQDYQKFEQACIMGHFPKEVEEKFSEIWESMQYPLAVRSSSVLEDQTGTSFAGKYATIFISNNGTREARWLQISSAIKLVYASIGSPNSIEYRRKHGYLNQEEKMAVMIQRAVGQEYNGYFFPLLAGVGFSQNGYCWHEEVRKEDGLVRVVFGLGTRAVGRGYARIFSTGNPTSRPEGYGAQAVEKYSQGTMDVLDIKANSLKSINFSEVVKDGFECYPGAEKLFSLRDGQTIYVPATRFWEPNHRPVLTFDAILAHPWAGTYYPKLMRDVMQILEGGFNCPIDMEFAGEIENGEFRLNILQARPLTQREEQNPEEMPDVKHEDILLTAGKDVPTGSIHDIEYIVYVDPDEYFSCPMDERHTVARVVGNLNRMLVGKKFILIGPGRWGSVKIELGVPAVYSEICNTSMLVEMAVGRYAPEVSFGTHFFQDLIEDGITYVPVFPDEEGSVFNENFFRKHNVFTDLLTDPHDRWFAKLIRVIHVPTATGGRYAHAVLNGVIEKGIIYLK